MFNLGRLCLGDLIVWLACTWTLAVLCENLFVKTRYSNWQDEDGRWIVRETRRGKMFGDVWTKGGAINEGLGDHLNKLNWSLNTDEGKRTHEFATPRRWKGIWKTICNSCKRFLQQMKRQMHMIIKVYSHGGHAFAIRFGEVFFPLTPHIGFNSRLFGHTTRESQMTVGWVNRFSPVSHDTKDLTKTAQAKRRPLSTTHLLFSLCPF